MKKYLYYLYYKLYKFFVAISDDFLNEWKPLAIISLLPIFLLLETLVWYSVIKRGFVELGDIRLPVILVSLSIVITNYYFFLHKGKWKLYVKEFDSYEKKKNIVGGIVVAIVVIGIFLSLVYSFYKLSQISNH